jgi:hypothetical protein
MEIAALRAQARRRRATANSIVEAIDRLQRKIDAIFPVDSAADESPAAHAKKKPLRK